MTGDRTSEEFNHVFMLKAWLNLTFAAFEEDFIQSPKVQYYFPSNLIYMNRNAYINIYMDLLKKSLSYIYMYI